MRLDFIWKVALKELLSTWRDKRTLRSTIILPLVFIPLFTIGFPLVIGRALGGQQEARQKVGVQGTLPADLRARLTNDTKGENGEVRSAGVDLVPVADARRAVTQDDVDAAIVVPAGLGGREGDVTRVQLISKASNQRVQAGAAAKVRDALRGYNDTLVARRLEQRGLNTSFLTPVVVQDVDASSRQEQSSGALAFIIPYFLLQFILAGAMAPAIDSTAGEKERGTLEVLLVSPVRRLEVVLGKLVATTLFATLTAVFGVAGFALAGPLSRLVLPAAGGDADISNVFGGTLSVGAGSVAALLLIAVTSALLLSALLIAVSVFARSYREAQTYVTPISILLIVPLFMLQFSDFITKSAWLYAAPLIGGSLAILDLVRGTPDAGNIAVAVVSNLVFAALLTAFGLRSFNREAVIFRN
jgi:sodium transport system permease protein